MFWIPLQTGAKNNGCCCVRTASEQKIAPPSRTPCPGTHRNGVSGGSPRQDELCRAGSKEGGLRGSRALAAMARAAVALTLFAALALTTATETAEQATLGGCLRICWKGLGILGPRPLLLAASDRCARCLWAASSMAGSSVLSQSE